MPYAPVYRVGPQPGGPLYVPDTQTTEKDPRQRSPLKCLNGRSYGEILAKEVFLLPATRGSKKDSDRAKTPAAEADRVPAHLALPGSPPAKQLCHLHTQLSLGQSCHRLKKSHSSILAWRILWTEETRGLQSIGLQKVGHD